MCRSRRELSNEYLLAKFGFGTAENEPCKVCPLSGGTAEVQQPVGRQVETRKREKHERKKIPRVCVKLVGSSVWFLFASKGKVA